MPQTIQNRQHAVNAKPPRTPAGDAFNDVLDQVIRLNRHFTTAAEALTRPAGQSLARWLVLAECAEQPATVSDIARRLHLARQSVQRVADALDRDGLCEYQDNPRHQRAKLVALTAEGRSALARIDAAQREWSNALGARIGDLALRRAHDALAPVLEAVEGTGGMPPA
jgi:DNA-binding MarR family transcriptional regulator